MHNRRFVETQADQQEANADPNEYYRGNVAKETTLREHADQLLNLANDIASEVDLIKGLLFDRTTEKEEVDQVGTILPPEPAIYVAMSYLRNVLQRQAHELRRIRERI